LNPADAGHCVTTVGKLFISTVPSGAEGRLNQLTLGIATSDKLFTCIGLGLLNLQWWEMLPLPGGR